MALLETFERQGNWLFKHRGGLPLAILVAGLAVHVHDRLRGLPTINTLEWVALAISLSGLCLRAYAVGHAPPNTSGRNTRRGQVADSLNTTGVYSVVRHPLYLGNFLAWLGVALLPCNPWFAALACLVFWLYYERVMFAEEQFLRGKFGESYASWAVRTPAFVPSPRLFVRPARKFSWRKVLRDEKNGLLALFLAFSAFDLAGWCAGGGAYSLFLAAATAASLLLYLVARHLKRKTRALEERQ
ncbi:MAG: isoprenylcysteine carboxylmethyltransferase family protein [Odoribacteraceae bacterium]|jgi:protein-S-isoprenylcysteine O-methyltransferase Ste14|nr:isoprenylcysteine carboxylmethyltransferase family protein [Odoribacteraceae bacterium]